MAAPLVTATVALVEAAHPTWSMSQVIDAVLNTATPDPALAGLVIKRWHRQCSRRGRQHQWAIRRLVHTGRGDRRRLGFFQHPGHVQRRDQPRDPSPLRRFAFGSGRQLERHIRRRGCRLE